MQPKAKQPRAKQQKEKKPKIGIDTGRSRPWLQPLWVRLLLVSIIVVWGVVELVHGAYGWAVLAAFIGAYAIWTYLVSWNRPVDAD